MDSVRATLERYQVALYLCAVVIAAGCAMWVGSAMMFLHSAINPALALMLYLTFLQVPVASLRAVAGQQRFLLALLVTNFLAIPALVACLSFALPNDGLVRLGVLLVLLAPCIDYVVTFAHMGRADARLLLVSTPILLLLQMLLLPLYLQIFLGAEFANLVQAESFLHAFVVLIMVPLLLAWATQYWATHSQKGASVASLLGALPVPATALALALVVAAVLPQLAKAANTVWSVIPIYITFAVLAPLLAWRIAKWCQLEVTAARAVAFSGGTRNGLVVLPLGLAIPDALPVLPAVIVAQTLVELLSELVYIKLIARWR